MTEFSLAFCCCVVVVGLAAVWIGLFLHLSEAARLVCPCSRGAGGISVPLDVSDIAA